ncbi:MAG: hypothetical protein WB562_09575 [Candidatus Sulfotelmatobacter sp.]
MGKRSATVGVASFVFLAVCGAVCQNADQSLPDAPSVLTATQKQTLSLLVEETRTPLKCATIGGYPGVMRQRSIAFFDQAVTSQTRSGTAFSKFLNSPSQQRGYYSSSDGNLLDRATHAASRIFVTRDDSGRLRLNTSYFLGALTSVAASTASRPSWRRSRGEPFSDFGSTVGNDAGLNLWREFRLGIQQRIKSHSPKFVASIGEGVARN